MGTSGSGSGSLSDASQDATDSDVSLLTSVEGGLPSGVDQDCYRASDTEVVWAKSVRGVWGLPNVFANSTCHVAEANFLPQGLEPPVKPAPEAAKPRAKPPTKSAAKPAAQVAAKPAAQPAAGEHSLHS